MKKYIALILLFIFSSSAIILNARELEGIYSGAIPISYFTIFEPMDIEELSNIYPVELDEKFLYGNYTIIRFSPEEILRHQKFLNDNNIATDGQIVGITIVMPGNLSATEIANIKEFYFIDNPYYLAEFQENHINPQTNIVSGSHVHNVRRASGAWFFPSQRLTVASTNGPNVTLSISQSATASNSFTSNISVTNSEVTAGVGFSVTASRTLAVSGTWTTPENSRGGMLEAFASYDRYLFDVMRFWLFNIVETGSGSAYRANGGIHFIQTIFN
jgi:hypothetical protein